MYIDVNASPLLLFEGKDGVSVNAAATVDNVAVSSKLESDNFVVIKLDSGSEAYRQFVQICILTGKCLKSECTRAVFFSTSDGL